MNGSQSGTRVRADGERVEVPSRFVAVLFGATGDLAHRKLMPALFELYKSELIRDFRVLATGRSQPDAETYRQELRESVEVASEEPEKWAEFEKLIDFIRMDVKSEGAFEKLGEKLRSIEEGAGYPQRRLFYLSVAPSLFGVITESLSKAGILEHEADCHAEGWSRLIVEKPFGHDLKSAQELDKKLKVFVDEGQVYRIDHYLGKETVQNLLAFRFANGMIEPLWNSHHIASVQITVAESLGVGERADYYDSAGALRDMVENHMLQLLALTAMEPPLSISPNDVRNEKVRVLRSIEIPKTPEEVAEVTVRGQYGPGTIGGDGVVGYRDEDGVDPESTTPTFVAARIHLKSWRWTGVPFYLRHGKRLPARSSEITVRFRTPPMHLFRKNGDDPSCPNVLTIRLQPDEGIQLSIGAKKPGPGMKIEAVEMGFSYAQAFRAEIPEAYERLLLDALNGDPTLFIRQDEVEAAWKWADAIAAGWKALPAPSFPNYAAGTDGPEDMCDLFIPLSGPRNSEPADGWRAVSRDLCGCTHGNDEEEEE